MFGNQGMTCNRSVSRFFGCPIFIGLIVSLLVSQPAYPQSKKPATRQSEGRVNSIEKRGKSIILKWQEPTPEGKSPPAEIELLITSKSHVQIKAPGLPSMLAEGEVIGAEIQEGDAGQLLTRKIVVYQGQHPAPGVMQDKQDPKRYETVGRIEEMTATVLRINFGSAGYKEVRVEENPEISVVTQAHAFLREGVEGTIEFLPNREAQKPGTLIKLEGTRNDPLDPAELEGSNLTKSKPATANPSSGTTKRPVKPVLKSGSTSGSKSTGGVPVKDPFGVLDK